MRAFLRGDPMKAFPVRLVFLRVTVESGANGRFDDILGIIQLITSPLALADQSYLPFACPKESTTFSLKHTCPRDTRKPPERAVIAPSRVSQGRLSAARRRD